MNLQTRMLLSIALSASTIKGRAHVSLGECLRNHVPLHVTVTFLCSKLCQPSSELANFDTKSYYQQRWLPPLCCRMCVPLAREICQECHERSGRNRLKMVSSTAILATTT